MPHVALARLRRGRHAVIAAAALVGVLAAGVATVHSTAATFTRSTGNAGSSFRAATILVTDDDAGSALFTTGSSLAKGVAQRSCLRVTYNGNAAGTVKVYASTGTDTEGLGSAVTLTIEQGTGGTFGSCTGFVVDPTGGSVYSGTLATFLSTTSSPATARGTWAPTGSGQSKVFRVTTTLSSTAVDQLQATRASFTLTWIARAGT